MGRFQCVSMLRMLTSGPGTWRPQSAVAATASEIVGSADLIEHVEQGYVLAATAADDAALGDPHHLRPAHVGRL